MSGRALYDASFAGDLARVTQILSTEAGVDVEYRDGRGCTPLIVASARGHPEVLQALLTHGADINAQENRGDTPLHVASALGERECVAALLAHPGVDLNAQDNNGDTALHDACKGDNLPVAELLLHAGADAQITNSEGKTPEDMLLESNKEAFRNLKEAKNDLHNEDEGNHIYVKTSKQTHLLNVNLTDTIGDVKKLVHEKEGIPAADKQILYHAGKQLQDGHTIGYYVPDKAVLDMLPQSDTTHWKWSEDEKKSLSEMSALCVIFLGEKHAGKSSLVNTILQGRPYTAHIDDRTVVADLSHWAPPGKEKMIFTFVDCGGHRSYRTTGQYFIRNSTNNVVVLCHDISVDELGESFAWIKMVYTGSPRCHILIVLTKVDVTEAELAGMKKDYFIKHFIEYIEEETVTLRKFIKRAEKAKNYLKINQLKELEKKYSWLIKNSRKIVIATSCKEGYIESVEPLTEALIKLAEDDDNMVLLPEDMKLLYIHIGKRGAKPPTVKSSTSDRTNEEIPANRKLSITASEASSNKPFQLRTAQPANVDSGNGDTLTAIALDSTIEKSHISRSFEADPYLYFDEVIPVYERILQKLCLATDDMEKKLKNSLTCLHFHSLLMYFLGGAELEKVVFHDMGTVMSIFTSVFHHKVPEFLEMATNDSARHEMLLNEHFDNNKDEFEQDRKLSKQGLFSTALVGYLLAVNDCSIRVEVVVQMLEVLETGFSFEPMKLSKPYIFIPFYVEEEAINPEKEKLVEEIKKFEKKDILSVQCSLKGILPITFWNYLVVALLKHLRLTFQTRDIWANGFFATVGKNKVKVLLLRKELNHIDFFVNGDISFQDGHNTIWKYVRILSEESDRLVRKWWPGLITSKTLACTNCRLMNATTKSRKIFEHDLNQILNEEPGSIDTCSCECSHEIPAALVYPLSKGAEQMLKEARDFLNTRVDPQITEVTKDSLEQLVQRVVQTKLAPYEDYAFRLPQIRNHHQRLVDNLSVSDVIDYLVPLFSVDDYEAIKALESTPRNQTRMFLYMVDKQGREALEEMIRAISEIPHLTHLLVHLQHQEEDGAQRLY